MDNINERAKIELNKLMQGNKNFVNGTPCAKNTSIETLKKFANYQNPNAAILTCSDSRVIPEIIFDCGIGEIFTVRVAGNSLGVMVVESLEYAVKYLKVPVLILMSHDDCGVMKYANKNFPNIGDDLHSTLQCVYHSLKEGETVNTDEFTKKHVHWVEKELLNKSAVINEAVKSGNLYIAKCHLDHSTGIVRFI